MAEQTDFIEATCKGCENRYVMLRTSRSKLCCSCRSAKRSRKKATIESRQPLYENALKSRAELAAYFEHDMLECLICGERKAGLYAHVRTAHNIDVEEYKKRANIPVSWGLTGKKTRSKMQACAADTTEKMASSGYANLAKARSEKKGESRQSWPTFMASEHAAKLAKSPNHPSQQEGEVDTICVKCGNTFKMYACIASAFQCRATCEDCKGG